MRTQEILKKTQSGEVLSKADNVYLLGLRPDSPEAYMVMAEANRLSKELSAGKAEAHAQFAMQSRTERLQLPVLFVRHGQWYIH